MSDYLMYGLGIAAQLLFGGRLLVQWLTSEKARKSLSPTLFWQLSLLASFLLLIYGILRKDPVIIGGQIFSYFIYIRNLWFNNAWKYLPSWFRFLAIGLPLAGLLWFLQEGNSYSFPQLIKGSGIPMYIMTWGTIAQVIFAARFVYQWICSEKEKQSVLPKGFWIISIGGSVLILVYGVLRVDPVIILGQVFGLAIYVRNLYFCSRRAAREVILQNTF